MENSYKKNMETYIEDGMVQVIRPERGRFSVETVKRWAAETLFIEEGIVASPDLDESINILHKYNYARIKL